MNRKSIISFSVAAVGLMVVFIWLAGGFTAKLPSQTKIEPSVAAEVGAQMTWTTIPQSRSFSGSMQARQQANLSARITARVADVLVDAGDVVEAGDVLLRLESDDLSSRVRQQEQSLAAAQARVNEARLNFQRSEQLVNQGLLPEARLDEARAQRDSVEAEFNRAREALSEARTSEGFSVIVAPFSGVISRRVVFTGDTATPGMQLLSLYDPTTLRLEASISESALARLSIGDELMVRLDALQQDVRGQVVEIEPAADAATRSFTVRLVLDAQGNLYPGMYGQVTVPVGERQGLLVPQHWVEQQGQIHFVWINGEQGIERRIVRLGDAFSQEGALWVEVVAGLQAGEYVVAP
ncbi:efflux RND transporter periplasmic adaptor subunit [Aliidiomarina indica]|uniref:efflux RND transporter periplasmic adaptor subunit n=1 Tax=Aliidiomarina indica TaxID=2749147 RepID=UPI00188E8A99|nr:efflux RND transporter periplasmic adaptor subunit [Aliidiomarina indica]